MELEVPSTTLSWEAGHAAIAAAVAHAQRLGVRINVAVCDASGLLVAFLRMPLSFPQSIELAIDKARTAAGFGFPTSKWMSVCGEDEAMKLGFSSRAGLSRVRWRGADPPWRARRRRHRRLWCLRSPGRGMRPRCFVCFGSVGRLVRGCIPA